MSRPFLQRKIRKWHFSEVNKSMQHERPVRAQCNWTHTCAFPQSWRDIVDRTMSKDGRRLSGSLACRNDRCCHFSEVAASMRDVRCLGKSGRQV